ncbi:MAG: hypothetical protein ACKOFI_10275, partial [Phycisphaerales bacterium]
MARWSSERKSRVAHDGHQHVLDAALQAPDHVGEARVAHAGAEVRVAVGAEELRQVAREGKRLVEHLLPAQQVALQEPAPQHRGHVG